VPQAPPCDLAALLGPFDLAPGGAVTYDAASGTLVVPVPWAFRLMARATHAWFSSSTHAAGPDAPASPRSSRFPRYSMRMDAYEFVPELGGAGAGALLDTGLLLTPFYSVGAPYAAVLAAPAACSLAQLAAGAPGAATPASSSELASLLQAAVLGYQPTVQLLAPTAPGMWGALRDLVLQPKGGKAAQPAAGSPARVAATREAWSAPLRLLLHRLRTNRQAPVSHDSATLLQVAGKYKNIAGQLQAWTAAGGASDAPLLLCAPELVADSPAHSNQGGLLLDSCLEQRAADVGSPASPVPHVLTAFNVMVDPMGALYAPELETAGGAADQAPHARGFKPVMCYQDANGVKVRGRGHPMHDAPRVREVVVVTQFWSHNIWHWYAESLTRLYPILDYVRSNPDVHVHVMGKDDVEVVALHRQVLGLLGVPAERVLAGWVQADIAHVPDGAPCGGPRMLEVMMGREVLRGVALNPQLPAPGAQWHHPELDSYYARHLGCLLSGSAGQPVSAVCRRDGPEDRDARVPPVAILIIRRRHNRRLENYEELIASLHESFASRARITVLDDNKLPQQREIYRLFATSDVVVAPHGSGMANILSLLPGSQVIEVNPSNELNLCFMSLTIGLSLRHDLFLHPEPMKADVPRVVQAIRDAWPSLKDAR
jgi:hypothetical protein